MAIWRPRISIFLVESAVKRANILRSMLQELGLTDVKICEHSVGKSSKRHNQADQQLLATNTSSQRIVTCRAFRPLTKNNYKQLLKPFRNMENSVGKKYSAI